MHDLLVAAAAAAAVHELQTVKIAALTVTCDLLSSEANFSYSSSLRTGCNRTELGVRQLSVPHTHTQDHAA